MIRWLGEDTFELGDARFLLEVGEDLGTLRSNRERFVLGKTAEMVERFIGRYGDRADVRNVVEIGILHGGSIVLDYEVCRPELLVAVDLDPSPVAALEDFVAAQSLASRVHLHYGVDQADGERLSAIIDVEFGGKDLDLVIDDASHLYEPTRASFEVLFPRLRPGGTYVIEDWDWAHYPGERWQEDGGQYAGFPALTNLVIEILMLAGTRPEIVSEVTVTRSLAEIVRGPAPLAAPMRLSALYKNRGLPFRPLL